MHIFSLVVCILLSRFFLGFLHLYTPPAYAHLNIFCMTWTLLVEYYIAVCGVSLYMMLLPHKIKFIYIYDEWLANSKLCVSNYSCNVYSEHWMRCWTISFRKNNIVINKKHNNKIYLLMQKKKYVFWWWMSHASWCEGNNV